MGSGPLSATRKVIFMGYWSDEISDNWGAMKLLDRAYPKQDEDQLKLFI